MIIPKKLPLAVCWLTGALALGWLASCQPNDMTPGQDGASDSPGGGSSGGDGSDGSGDAGGHSDGGSVTDANAETGGLGLLVDNMTATSGTQISLKVPAGQTPGSYYAYSDFPYSFGLPATQQLADTPLASPITNADGSQIIGELCIGGNVAGYAGLGMSLAYGNPPDAAPESGLSSPVPFDASHYSGVSFYILVDPTDGSAPSFRFGVPDTQTADPSAWPTTACRTQDAGAPSDASDVGPATNPCDDDFGSDLTITPGVWTKMALKWGDMAQQTWGAQFPGGMKTDQVIGMKWQVNGGGIDAATEAFHFCISDIYFTP